jgi:hypothetical protein
MLANNRKFEQGNTITLFPLAISSAKPWQLGLVQLKLPRRFGADVPLGWAQRAPK